jgi:hypothetical protein
MRAILVIAAVLALLPAVQAAQVTLITQDEAGDPLPARLHVVDALGGIFPGYPDSTYLSHDRLGGYFYTAGTMLMDLPTGPTRIGALHGFEHDPFEGVVTIQGDTTLVITLPRRFNLRGLGWYGGDIHTHTIHAPVDFEVSPHAVLRIAEAEDLKMIWVLDSGHEFTGGDHQVSTWENIIYYTVEYRNQAYGHAALLGLVTHFGDWCCGPPNLPAYPMLTFIHDEWMPGYGQAMCLAHPHTGGDFFNDETWPGVGLGRELPVMAALGTLDALELASYSNNPDLFLDDWYGLLNCGLRVSPAAGTDAVLCNYHAPPPGGHRVYVYEGLDQSHDSGRWTEALKAGRSFVTNFPLIPLFEVDGVMPGEDLLLDQAGEVEVAFRIESIFGLDAADLIFNGAPLLSIPDPCGNPAGVLDTTLTVPIAESGWLALSVTGQTDAWGPVTPDLYAHTAPVYLTVPDSEVSSTVDAGYFMDWVDSLQIFVDLRGNWSGTQRQEVMAALQATRHLLRTAFQVAPEPFALISPEENEEIVLDEVIEFDWEMNGDIEPGDRIEYILEVADNPDLLPLILGIRCEAPPQQIAAQWLSPNTDYWWRVRALDRGGNITVSTPPSSPFRTGLWVSDVVTGEGGDISEEAGRPAVGPHVVIWPAPVTERLNLQIFPPNAEVARMRILDSSGRVVREGHGPDAPLRSGLRRSGPGFFAGRLQDSFGVPLATGRYWIQLEGHAGADEQAWRQSAPILIVR